MIGCRYVDKCDSGENSCLQYWTIFITVGSEVQCNLNDVYTVTFTSICLYPVCPDWDTQNVTMSLTISSTDFCPQLVEDVSFTLSVSSYSDSGNKFFVCESIGLEEIL